MKSAPNGQEVLFSVETGSPHPDLALEVFDGFAWNRTMSLLTLSNEPGSELQAQPSPYDPGQPLSGLRAAAGPTAPAAPVPVSDLLQQRSPNHAGTVLEVWQAACQQIAVQLDRASFATWFRDALLVDFEAATHTLIVVVPNEPTRAALDGRLRRTLLRILSHGFGQPVAVDYVLREAWVGHALAADPPGASSSACPNDVLRRGLSI